jgi:hypothetical protein
LVRIARNQLQIENNARYTNENEAATQRETNSSCSVGFYAKASGLARTAGVDFQSILNNQVRALPAAASREIIQR